MGSLKPTVCIIVLNFLLCFGKKPKCAEIYSHRILNEEKESPTKFPFVVRIWAQHGYDQIMVGSGFIISEWHIITSAHIVSIRDTGILPARFRHHHRYHSASINVTIAPGGKSEKTVQVEKFFVKGAYMETGDRRDDMAILKLKERLTFSPEVKKAILSMVLPKQNSAILAAIGCDAEVRECHIKDPTENSLQYPSQSDDEEGEIIIDESFDHSMPDEIIPDYEVEVEDHGSTVFLPARVRTYTVKLGSRAQCLRRKVPYGLLCGGGADPQGQRGDSGGPLVIYDNNGYAYVYGVYAGTRPPISPGHLEFVFIAFACEWVRSVTNNEAVCRLPDRFSMRECTL